MTSAMPSDTIKTVVLGAGGYVGGELLRLLAGHPRLQLVAAVSNSRAGEPIGAAFNHLRAAYPRHNFVDQDSWLDSLATGEQLALFCAAPHGSAAALLATALDAAASKQLTTHVVDASADFRYATASAYQEVYAGEHGAPQLLDQFCCAVPEHLPNTRKPHVGHPGCFATAILLATVPLLQAELIHPEVFVAATTGSTGSGQAPQAGTHHPQRHGNQYAYKPLQHRHAPEIRALAAAASGQDCRINFVPQSGAFARGIYATVQAKLRPGTTAPDVQQAFDDAYRDAAFVALLPAPPKLKDVVASNYCHLATEVAGDTVVVMSALDNLVKGAAGGAIQWMNRLWGLPETAGLQQTAPGWT